MASQTGQSSLLAKLGPRGVQIANANKVKEPELPNMGLPAGIENGIAQVRELKFGVVPEGKNGAGALFLMGQAIVKRPKEHEGTTIAGQRTMIYKVFTDPKKKSAEQPYGEVIDKNFQWVQDQLKMLAGRGADPELFSLGRMEATAAALAKKRVYTAFRTWKGDKQDVRNLSLEEARDYRVKPGWWLCNFDNKTKALKGPVEGKGPYASEEFARQANKYAGREPMVNHQWGGVVEYTEEAGPDIGAVSYNGQAGVDASAAAEGLPSGVEPAEENGGAFDEFAGQESGESGAGEGEREGEDLDALAAACYNDAASQKQLAELAGKVGISEEEVNAAEKWEDIAERIREARAVAGEDEGDSDESADPEGWKPAKGEVVFYGPKVNGKPQLGKNKKPIRLEVEVLTVDAAGETCTVKDLTTKKPLLGPNKKPLAVAWVDLSEE